MSNIFIYNYSPETKEFLSKQIADRDNAASDEAQKFIPLIPAYATLVEPHKAKENQTNVFDETNNTWTITADYRKQYMVNDAMTPEEVTKLGDLPSGYVIITTDQIQLLEQYGPNYFCISNNTLVVNPNYNKIKEKERKANFESTFIETSWGWYRKVPKGYSNAPQSIDIIDRLVSKFNGFTAQINEMMIFYQKPDFSKEKECTEDWLVAHQYKHGVCSKEDFDTFYLDFQIRWAANQYK